MSVDAKALMEAIQKDFNFKKNKIEPPSMYLGARLEMKAFNGKSIWTMCSKDYIKLAVMNIENQLKGMGMKLLGKALTQWIVVISHNWTRPQCWTVMKKYLRLYWIPT